MYDYIREQENREWEQEQERIRVIVDGLTTTLVNHEEYFLQEAVKRVHLDGMGSHRKIVNAIIDVLISDPNKYLDTVEDYQKELWSPGRIKDALDIYAENLEKKLVGWLSNEVVDHYVASFVGFLQRKDVLIEKGEIDETKTDIDNFLLLAEYIHKPEDKIQEAKNLLEKIWPSKVMSQIVIGQSKIVENIDSGAVKTKEQQKVEKTELVNTLHKIPLDQDSLNSYAAEVEAIRADYENQYFLDQEIGWKINTSEKKEYANTAWITFLDFHEDIKNNKKAQDTIKQFLCQKNIL